MSSEIAPSNKAAQALASPKDQARYREFINETVAIVRQGEAANVERYWDLGITYKKFLEFSERTGGAFNHAQFIADLAQAGYEVGSSTLYFARKIADKYLIREKLVANCERGLTIGHLKALLSLDEQSCTKVEAQLVLADGTLLSTRELQKLVEEQRRLASQAKLETAMADDKPAAKPKKGGPLPKDNPAVEGAEDLFAGVDGDTQVGFADEPKLTTPEKGEKPEAAGATGGKPGSFTKSPISVFSKLDKDGYRLLEQIADGLIAVKEMTKIGYDSDKAHAAAKAKLKDARATLANLIEPVQKLLEEIKDLGDD